MRKILFLILVINHSVFSQDINSEKKKPFIVFKPDSIDDGRFLLTPFLSPGYTPELGWVLALGGYFSFKTKNKPSVKRSSSPLSIAYSTTGAMIFNLQPIIYFNENKFIIYGDFWHKSMPDNYFGVGYDNASTRVKGEETSYYRNWWWMNPRFFWQLKPNWFVGLNVDVNYTKGKEESKKVSEDEVYKHYNEKPLNTGIGYILRYDSRDVPMSTYEGFYLDIRYTNFSTVFGGDNNYSILQVDTRKFIKLGRKENILALQGKYRWGIGDVPYGEMSQLGTPFDLRGYLWGRYRDNSMVYGLMEYRHKLYYSGKPTRHSLVGWTGLGSVFDERTTKYHAIPNIGVGYRLEIQPRVSVRLDYGIGIGTSGFYFNFQEAF